MNKHGLYSKAAQIIRSLPQEKGTAEQMIGAAKKLGIKQVEIDNAKPPTGPITREALAKHFEDAIPNLGVTQYGENPRYTTRDDERRGSELISRDQLSPEEEVEYNRIRQRRTSRPNVETSQYEGDEDYFDTADTQYGAYTIPGGKDYRERLLRLERPTGSNEPSFRSSHWSDHPNVLAHIRMSDRMVGEDRETVRPIAQKLADHFKVGIRDLGSYAADQGVKDGVVSPEEAASFARVMNFPFSKHHSAPGIGKRLLHVEELQSDWGQEGRDQGFNTGAARKAYDDHVDDMRARMRQKLLDQGLPENVAKPLYEGSAPWQLAKYHGETDQQKLTELDKAAYAEATKKMPPPAPYVQSTQHWTDLALKNVLREAALGNYDGVVFTPGQAQADRYGLEKQVSGLQLIRDPNASSFGTLNAWDNDGRRAFSEQVKDENHLGSLIGKEVAQKLLSSEKRGGDAAFGQDPSIYSHNLAGEDLKVGGEGMKGYYDNIVPKSVMALAKQHDPSAKPGEPITLQSNDGDYQGFHLPMTETMKNSILDKGFSAFKRGGSVDAALALTRRFTRGTSGATMPLKFTGK
jgi:hypothetical protein